MNPDQALLPAVIEAVRAAGLHLLDRFSVDARVSDMDDLRTKIRANDAASLSVLHDALLAARPTVGWIDDEEGTGALPSGEWWVTDPVEGNINHIHGIGEWGVTATLVRDNEPVLAVAYLPLTDETYTAVRGAGAHRNGVRLSVSDKTDLRATLVGTAQAAPGENATVQRRIGQSVTAMLGAALVVRVLVPATLVLIQVAAGRMDAFWQYSQVRVGLMAGALFTEEAGGRITDIEGRPWTATSESFLATTPGIHTAAVQVLSAVA